VGNPGFTKICSPDVPLLSTDTGIFNSQNTPWSPGGYQIWFELGNITNAGKGTWKVTYADMEGGNEMEKALFDEEAIVTFTSTGEFLFYAPSIRLAIDDNGKLTGFDISWWAMDPATGNLREVTDFSTFSRLAGGKFGLNLSQNGVDFTEPYYERKEYTLGTTHSESFNESWYIPGTAPDDSRILDCAGFWYSIAGVEFGFNISTSE